MEVRMSFWVIFKLGLSCTFLPVMKHRLSDRLRSICVYCSSAISLRYGAGVCISPNMALIPPFNWSFVLLIMRNICITVILLCLLFLFSNNKKRETYKKGKFTSSSPTSPVSGYSPYCPSVRA